MKFPVTGYVVFVHNNDIGAHAPQFCTLDEAEEFANGLRATTDLTVSEPIPVVATESKKSNLMEVKYGL
tara:strand:+ start:690 stop:896 length:207 start_codon:yes stop_codon:yes gene_type:complete